MPKRSISESEPQARKKFSSSNPGPTVDIQSGEILTDITGKQWRLGKTVGIGGFGAIYLATDNTSKEADDTCRYVCKVETHTSGPLFVEINCYIRIAKQDLINEWMQDKSLKKLGMPHYVASGSHTLDGVKLRFLIIPRFGKNLEEVHLQNKQQVDMKTVLVFAIQLLDVIEYIHSKGFIHCDVKASNIMLRKRDEQTKIQSKPSTGDRITKKCRSKKKKKKNADGLAHCLRSNSGSKFVSENFCGGKSLGDDHEQAYLVDFGLVSKYRQPDGRHKEFCCDQRKAHAGTLLFCSLDAHNGVQARRSDLESLGYNLVYWLTSTLPWMAEEDPVVVHKTKQKCLMNLHEFLESCFVNSHPKFIYDYFKYLVELDFASEPDYSSCRELFKRALQTYGYNNQCRLANIQDCNLWRRKRELGLKKYNQISYKLNRVPLSTKPSNLPLKPRRRLNKNNKKKVEKLSWSKILIDPEDILKRGKVRDRKLTESSDSSGSVQTMDLEVLNPTYAMVQVYNRSMERLNSGVSPKPQEESSDYIEGYTPAMMSVFTRKLEREQFERELCVIEQEVSNRPRRGRPPKLASKSLPLKKDGKKKSPAKKMISRNVTTRVLRSHSRYTQ